MRLTRREFLVLSAIGSLGIIGGYIYLSKGRRREQLLPDNQSRYDELGTSKVYIVETSNRNEGTRKLLNEFTDIDFHDKSVAIKANFNSADPPPASTHLETLETLVKHIQANGAAEFTLAERSGMGDTSSVLKSMGVYDLSDRLGFNVVSLDEINADGWEKIYADWLSWKNGFYISKIFREADRVIQTCCLKTHRYGGHFTMALKNSVGLVAKRVPGESHDYMRELHSSPQQRLMIGEINAFYDVDFIIMDAVEAFITGGPDQGDHVRPELMLASRDRVAIDAVGVAILRSYGSTKDVMDGKIFELDQIRRAAETGVGVSSVEKIELVPINENATARIKEIKKHLT